MKVKKFEVAVVVGLVLAVLCSTVSFAKTGTELKEDVLRLHILANSDTVEDQELKLKVRDAIIEREGQLFDNVNCVTQAKTQVVQDFGKIQSIANKVIKDSGYSYPVSVALERTYFETRQYEDFTLPAGYYEALRVVIGEGEGHNWWCVVYPPLCVNSAKSLKKFKKLTAKERKLVLSNPKYDIRFKSVEFYHKILKSVKKTKK